MLRKILENVGLVLVYISNISSVMQAVFSLKPCNGISFSNCLKIMMMLSHENNPLILWKLKTELIVLSCAYLDAFWESIDLVNCRS